jgi:hypothetical protein
MFDSAETDTLSVERKSDEVVTVLVDNANAECVGKSSIRVKLGLGHEALKDFEGRLFEEQLGASYPCVGQRFVVNSRREGVQR